MACINERDYEARRNCRLNLCPYSKESEVGKRNTDAADCKRKQSGSSCQNAGCWWDDYDRYCYPSSTETQVGEGGSYYFGGEYLDNCRTNSDCNSGNCKKRSWMDVGRCGSAAAAEVGEGGSYYFGGEYLDNCRTNSDCNSGNCKKRSWMDVG